MAKDREYKKNLLIVILFFGIFVLTGMGLFLYKEATRFRYEEHLDDWVVSCGDDSVTLREFGYYILLMEKDTQETAYTYDSNQPINYWNLYIGTEGKLGYVRNLSKEYAVAYCMRDALYRMKMEEESYRFTEEEQLSFEEAATDLAESFSEIQLSKVGLTKEDFVKMAVSVSEVHAYLESYTAKGISEEELDIQGNYYQSLKEEMNTAMNQELLEHLSFGSITVN